MSTPRIDLGPYTTASDDLKMAEVKRQFRTTLGQQINYAMAQSQTGEVQIDTAALESYLVHSYALAFGTSFDFAISGRSTRVDLRLKDLTVEFRKVLHGEVTHALKTAVAGFLRLSMPAIESYLDRAYIVGREDRGE